jgi:hypothetical protein
MILHELGPMYLEVPLSLGDRVLRFSQLKRAYDSCVADPGNPD